MARNMFNVEDFEKKILQMEVSSFFRLTEPRIEDDYFVFISLLISVEPFISRRPLSLMDCLAKRRRRSVGCGWGWWWNSFENNGRVQNIPTRWWRPWSLVVMATTGTAVAMDTSTILTGVVRSTLSKNPKMKIRCGGPLQQRSCPEHGCDQMIGGAHMLLNTTNRWTRGWEEEALEEKLSL